MRVKWKSSDGYGNKFSVYNNNLGRDLGHKGLIIFMTYRLVMGDIRPLPVALPLDIRTWVIYETGGHKGRESYAPSTNCDHDSCNMSHLKQTYPFPLIWQVYK